ncbi:MAG: hypothetical protein QXP01_06035 [Candidatus Hadarchaeum sp.]
MCTRLIGAWGLSLCLIGEAMAGSLGGRGFASLSIGGASLICEGGTFDVLQGDFRGPVLTVGGTNVTIEYTGYRAAYDGCLLVHGTVGYRFWRGLSLTLGAELGWPRYRLVAYSKTSGLYPYPAWGEEPGAPGLKVSEKSVFLAPTVGARFQLVEHSAGPYVFLEWGKVFRHAHIELDRHRYYTGPPYETRVRDRDTKGLMRAGIGSEYAISGRISLALSLCLTSVRDSGLFFLDYESGAQYITFDGRVGLTYRL